MSVAAVLAVIVIYVGVLWVAVAYEARHERWRLGLPLVSLTLVTDVVLAGRRVWINVKRKQLLNGLGEATFVLLAALPVAAHLLFSPF